MRSELVDTLKLKFAPVAVLVSNDLPQGAVQFKQGRMGCVAAMILTASKGRIAAFDRTTFGCPGGGVGLGLGNCYQGFPIEQLLSTGGEAVLPNGHTFDMKEGERFHKSPEITSKWVATLPIRDVPGNYVVLKCLDQVSPEDDVSVVLFMVNPDQLSALVTLSDFDRGSNQSVMAPFGAACQSILYAMAEAEKPQPRAVIGMFDISQRNRLDRDILSFTVPFGMFKQMEANVPDSFLRTHVWKQLQERL